MKRFFNLAVALLLSTLVWFPEALAQDYITPYRNLLSSYVKPGKKEGIEGMVVNYAGWAKDSQHALAMENLTKINPETFHDKHAQMAFWINAYNLLTIDLIVKSKEEESINNLGGLFTSPWKKHKWEIGNRHYTLDEIEHEILRPMNDPRVHMAINCASLSCPDLRPEPYMRAKLDNQLDDQVKIFLNNDQKGMKQTGELAEVSSIFKWFREDFGDEKGVVAFINEHRHSAPPIKRISNYIDYNWQLNG